MVKKTLTRKQVEDLFENVIADMDHLSNRTESGTLRIGKRKLGTIRYFLGVRLNILLNDAPKQEGVRQ